MLVIGGGIIGLEMATVYSTLGARVDVVEMLDGLMQGPDRDLVKVWEKQNAPRFDKIMLKTKTASGRGQGGRHLGQVRRRAGTSRSRSATTWSCNRPAAARTASRSAPTRPASTVTERGFIPVDTQMRTNVPHIFAIGDIVGQPMLAHKAVHEGHVAAEAAAGQKSHFDATVIPGVAYTHPEVAWVGLRRGRGEEGGPQGRRSPSSPGRPPAAPSPTAPTTASPSWCSMQETHRVVGGSIVGPGAGDMIGEIALAIEMGADAVDIGKTIHPHPTLGETIGMAAEVAHGSCTDLPAPRRK